MRMFFTLTSIQMLQVPAVTILVIAATRMYRSLVDFASETTDMLDILSFHIYRRSLFAAFTAFRIFHKQTVTYSRGPRAPRERVLLSLRWR